jgi:hypothetical protein
VGRDEPLGRQRLSTDAGRQVSQLSQVVLSTSSLWFSLRVVKRNDLESRPPGASQHVRPRALLWNRGRSQACERRSRTLKISFHLPPTTGFLSTRECHTRGLSRACCEALLPADNHVTTNWRGSRERQTAALTHAKCITNRWWVARSARGLKS